MNRLNVLRVVAGLVLLLTLAYFVTLGRPLLDRLLGDLRHLGPGWFYLFFAVSTTLGVPPLPFLLLAGATFDPFSNIAGVTLSFVFSVAAGYWVSRPLFAELLRKFLMKVRVPVDRLSAQGNWQVIAMVRLTPGFPFVLQNCLLSSICSRFGFYYVVSLPCVLFMAFLPVFLGSSFKSGKLPLILAAGVVLVGATLGLKWFSRRRLNQSAGSPPSDASPGGSSPRL